MPSGSVRGSIPTVRRRQGMLEIEECYAGGGADADGPDDPARLVVKAAAVAHQGSPGRAGDDVSSGGHTVLKRH